MRSPMDPGEPGRGSASTLQPRVLVCPLFSLLLSCVQTSSALLWGLPEGSLPGGAGNVGLTPTGQKCQCSDIRGWGDGFLFAPDGKGGSGGVIAGAGTGVDPLSPEGAVGCVSVWGV